MNVRENCGRKYNWNNTLTNTEKEYRGALYTNFSGKFISENALHFYSTNYFPKNIFLSIISLVSFQVFVKYYFRHIFPSIFSRICQPKNFPILFPRTFPQKNT